MFDFSDSGQANISVMKKRIMTAIFQLKVFSIENSFDAIEYAQHFYLLTAMTYS